jgi:hypothetical protein
LDTGINKNFTTLYAAESYCLQAVGDINTYPGRPGHVSFTIDPSHTFTGIPFMMLPNATTTPYPRPSTSAPLASGVRDDCVYNFKGDDYQFTTEQLGVWKRNCELAATLHKTAFNSFAGWNSLRTNVTDPACIFEVGKRYCGAGAPQPSPTHPGQTADCDGWHFVTSGDSCQSAAENAGISLADFYGLNAAVPKDCTTNFWLGQAYCVGVSGSTRRIHRD